LNAPFFMPAKELGLDAYRFIFEDPDFAVAFKNALALAAGLALSPCRWAACWPS
jgi:iron(III) transport system permease protein